MITALKALLAPGLRSLSRKCPPTGCIWRPSKGTTAALLAAAACAAGPGPAFSGAPEFCVTCSGPPAQYRCTFDDTDGHTPSAGLQLYCISTLAREGKHESCAIGRATKQTCPGTLKVLAMPNQPAADPAQAAAPAEKAPKAPSATAVDDNTAPPSDDVEMHGATPGKISAPAREAPAEAAPAPEPAKAAAKPAAVPVPAAEPAWKEGSGPPAASGNTSEAQQQPATAAGSSTETPAGPPETPDLVKPLEKAGEAVGDAAKSTGSALSKAGEAVGSAAKKSWKCLTSLFGDC